eukprot:1151687-Pelagomonas_calceolata.AAC.2
MHTTRLAMRAVKVTVMPRNISHEVCHEGCHNKKALGSASARAQTRCSYPEMHELLMQINRCMGTG